MKWFPLILFLLVTAALVTGTLTRPHFWRTPDQSGDALLRRGKFAEAAKACADPWRAGMALYRNGDFEAAAKSFARVPGAGGAFNQGNALLMHGKYTAAIAAYDRALGFHAGWKEAEENKAVAVARKAKLDASGKDRDEEQADAYKPDEIVFDQKGDNQKGKPVELAQPGMSDEALRETWLRQIHTTPAEFLRARFAWQAAHSETGKEDSK
jgi:Ca-activated chloride channel family protein